MERRRIATHAARMPNYRRAWIPGGTYFFTLALVDRRSRLLVEHIDTLREALRMARMARPFRLDAIVVLPEHLHMICTMPLREHDFAKRIAHFKAAFSRGVPTRGPPCVARTGRRERGVWQRRYWEHVIRNEADLHAHLDYVHYNPVKHGHVTCVCDWP